MIWGKLMIGKWFGLINESNLIRHHQSGLIDQIDKFLCGENSMETPVGGGIVSSDKLCRPDNGKQQNGEAGNSRKQVGDLFSWWIGCGQEKREEGMEKGVNWWNDGFMRWTNPIRIRFNNRFSLFFCLMGLCVCVVMMKRKRHFFIVQWVSQDYLLLLLLLFFCWQTNQDQVWQMQTIDCFPSLSIWSLDSERLFDDGRMRKTVQGRASLKKWNTTKNNGQGVEGRKPFQVKWRRKPEARKKVRDENQFSRTLNIASVFCWRQKQKCVGGQAKTEPVFTVCRFST